MRRKGYRPATISYSIEAHRGRGARRPANPTNHKTPGMIGREYRQPPTVRLGRLCGPCGNSWTETPHGPLSILPTERQRMPTLYPGADFFPLGAQTQSPLRQHNIICVHTMVGYLVSTDRYFRIGNGQGYQGTESHFGIGGKWGPDVTPVSLDGAVYQWQDLDYQADANLDGNGEVVSIETADNAARPIEPWTPAQVDSLVALCAWLCLKYSIPPVIIPDTKPGRRGLAYHAQGAAERVPGGVQWSTTPSKDCPTAARIAQFRYVVAPLVRQRLSGITPPSPEEDDDMRPMLVYADNTPLYVYYPSTGALDGIGNALERDVLTKLHTQDQGPPITVHLNAAELAALADFHDRKKRNA